MLSDYIDSNYFREYRQIVGFTNQGFAKSFFGAKDVHPSVDINYIVNLNARLFEIIDKINKIVPDSIKYEDIREFEKEFITDAFETMKEHSILSRLNNQGRRPEEVYFSWMRGYTIANYFMKALSRMFGINLEDIEIIGEDDLKKIETFKRTPTADLQLNLDGIGKVRLEVQSGFQGINDIKQHKVMVAKRIFQSDATITLVIHFDIYNGQVGIVRVDNVSDNDINWITRQQLEGQTVFNIDQNYFVWKLTEDCPTTEDIKGIITKID